MTVRTHQLIPPKKYVHIFTKRHASERALVKPVKSLPGHRQRTHTLLFLEASVLSLCVCQQSTTGTVATYLGCCWWRVGWCYVRVRGGINWVEEAVGKRQHLSILLSLKAVELILASRSILSCQARDSLLPLFHFSVLRYSLISVVFATAAHGNGGTFCNITEFTSLQNLYRNI